MNISIALCTYNGEKFLQEQLDSIAGQSRLPDELVVCDDMSGDNTLEILNEFKQVAPFSVRIIRNETNLGPAKNFEKAICLCKGRWLALCDQDDLWLSDKIEISVKKMKQMEAVFGENTPILVHTDAIIANSDLDEIGPSLWRFQHTFPEKGHKFAKLLNQNVVTGCTAIVNRALCDKALPIPETVIMHDWWFALVASTFGQIGCIPESTLLYRQHGRNDTGAKSWGFRNALKSLFDYKNKDYVLKTDKEILRRTKNQASAFLKQYQSDLSFEQKDTISAFLDLHNHSYLARKYLIIKYGLHYQGLLRNIGNLILK